MPIKDERSDAWSDLDSELNRIQKTLDNFRSTPFRDLEDELTSLERDLTDARNAADRLEKLIDKMGDEE